MEPCYATTAGSNFAGFRPSLSGASGTATRGVWSILANSPTILTFVTDDKTLAPSVLPLTPFFDFHAPSVNSAGEVAFRGCVNSSCSNDGIWKGSNAATLGLVALALKPAPDDLGSTSAAQFEFTDFSNPTINSSGHVVFQSAIRTTATQQPAGNGIWAESIHAPGLARIVKTGDRLRNTNLTFTSIDPIGTFTGFVMNDQDQLVFTADVTDGTTVTKGLFFVTPGLNSVFKIARVSEFYDVAGSAKQINFIDFHAGAIDQGASGFTHDGTVAYRVNFTIDGTRALILTTIDT